MSQSNQSYDVVIVGAGLSGIGAAYHIQEKCPKHTFTLFEARSNIGGTWDLFKYPGIRSDSDMYTFGFSFNPWKDPQAIADGPAILKYINETADKFGIREKIQFNNKVVNADWFSSKKKWILQVQNTQSNTIETVECNFLFMCSGYYNYAKGHEPQFPNSESFEGTIMHPQKWDTNYDYSKQKVVIIGSGATAVTLLPEMSKKASAVTMLQRSPTYIMNLPREDAIANFTKKIMPAKWAHGLARWKNILFGLAFYQAARKWPGSIKNLLKKQVKKSLGDHYEDQHFDPKYNPWDQRLCLIPDNDMFEALKDEDVNIVTDTIKEFTPQGIQLNSGKHLDADLIVTATGLQIQLFGGMKISVDGVEGDTSTTHAYKGVMFSDVPNFAVALGYTNASWTLKCDLNCHFVTKVLNHMKENNYSVCTPKFDHNNLETERLLDFDAGYVLRAEKVLPKQGSKAPWKVYQNYIKDLFSLKYGKVVDEYLEYNS